MWERCRGISNKFKKCSQVVHPSFPWPTDQGWNHFWKKSLALDTALADLEYSRSSQGLKHYSNTCRYLWYPTSIDNQRWRRKTKRLQNMGRTRMRKGMFLYTLTFSFSKPLLTLILDAHRLGLHVKPRCPLKISGRADEVFLFMAQKAGPHLRHVSNYIYVFLLLALLGFLLPTTLKIFFFFNNFEVSACRWDEKKDRQSWY